MKPGKRFHQFVGSIEKDSRYKAVRNSEDRERWAYDYIEDLERKEKERRDSAKKALKDAFSSFDFTHQSTWRDCEKNFGDNETFKTKDVTIIYFVYRKRDLPVQAKLQRYIAGNVIRHIVDVC